ncbi:MAG: Na+/H+ antiporter subunit E [Actinomycetota bacterium]|nr:Na+/H+ antiporter subunit E [Actinomycetota bacterium]
MAVLQLSIVLFGFWVLILGSFNPSGLATGLVLSVLVAWFTERTLWTEDDAPYLTLRQAGRFFVYVGFLVKEIVWANIYVAEKVLDPRLPIDPLIIEHLSALKRPVSGVALANSITLTPGTLTVDVDGSVFFIHCLDREFADDIASRKLDHIIAKVFEE